MLNCLAPAGPAAPIQLAGTTLGLYQTLLGPCELCAHTSNSLKGLERQEQGINGLSPRFHDLVGSKIGHNLQYVQQTQFAQL